MKRYAAPGRNKPGSKYGDKCVCTSCGYMTVHIRATLCNRRKCPQCGALMVKG